MTGRAADTITAPMAERVLMIEDDAALAGLVADYLRPFGFEVSAAGTAAEGLTRLGAEPFAAVLLDVMLPDSDGFEVCRRIRSDSDVPVLMLTARGQDEDRIVGLELGADDYLPKPFNPRELLARLRAVMRRRNTASRSARLLRFGRLEVDRDARVVRVDGEERPLTGYQFDLLVALADSAGRVLGRETLMARAGHDAGEAFDRSIDVHVSRIRAAIEDDPRRPRRLLTVRGAGYVFARKQDED
jgi:DNA-binding response OmpR family regulator